MDAEQTAKHAYTANLRAFVETLPESSAVRRVADDVLVGRSPRTIRPLIAALTSPSRKRRREREAAVRLLGAAHLAEQDRYVAASVLSGVLENSPREALVPRLVRAVGWAALATVVLIPIMVALERYIRATGFTPFSPADPQLQNLQGQELVRRLAEANDRQLAEFVRVNKLTMLATLGIWIPGMLMAFGGSLWSDRRRYRGANRLRVAAAEALGRLGAPEGAAALLAALSDRDAHVRQQASQSLRKVLPVVGEEQAEHLEDAARTALGRATLHDDAELALEAVRALAWVGRASELPSVEQAAARGATEEIRSAAAATAVVLREKHRQDTLRATLLRPNSPPAHEDFLLRPAAGSAEADPENLLRASG